MLSQSPTSKAAVTPSTRPKPLTLEDLPDPDGGGEAMSEKLRPAKIRQTKSAIWDTRDKDRGAKPQQSTKPCANVTQGKVSDMVRLFNTRMKAKGPLDPGNNNPDSADNPSQTDNDSKTSEDTDSSASLDVSTGLDEETESNAKNGQPEQERKKTKKPETRKGIVVKPVPRPRSSLKTAPNKAAAAANTDATLKPSRIFTTDSQLTDIPDHDSTRKTNSGLVENRASPSPSFRQRQGSTDSKFRLSGTPPKREGTTTTTTTTKSGIPTRCGGIQFSGGKTGRIVARTISCRSSSEDLQDLVDINSAVNFTSRSLEKLQISDNSSKKKRIELVKAHRTSKSRATEQKELMKRLAEEAVDRKKGAIQGEPQTSEQLSSFAVVQPVRNLENWKVAIGFVVTVAVLVVCIYLAVKFMTSAE